MPLISAIYDPRTAAVTFLLIDAATGIAVLPTVWRQANWREVFPLAAAAVFAGQFGALILQYTDPVALRWGMVVVVLTVLGVLMSGWHYHGKPLLIVTLGVGLIAGLLGGAVQIVGPPIILYWLGSASAAAVVRANFSAVLRAVRVVAVRDLSDAGPAGRAGDRARLHPRTGSDPVAVNRNTALPPCQCQDISARRLRDHPDRGAGEHADPRFAISHDEIKALIVDSSCRP